MIEKGVDSVVTALVLYDCLECTIYFWEKDTLLFLNRADQTLPGSKHLMGIVCVYLMMAWRDINVTRKLWIIRILIGRLTHNMQMRPEYLMRVVNVMALPKNSFPTSHKLSIIVFVQWPHRWTFDYRYFPAAGSVWPDHCNI